VALARLEAITKLLQKAITGAPALDGDGDLAGISSRVGGLKALDSLC
jgi:hypothetical protein